MIINMKMYFYCFPCFQINDSSLNCYNCPISYYVWRDRAIINMMGEFNSKLWRK